MGKNMGFGAKWSQVQIPTLLLAGCVTFSKLLNLSSSVFSYKMGVMILSVCLVAQSCLTLCDSMDYSLPGSSVHRILHARVLEWVAIPFSRGSS